MDHLKDSKKRTNIVKWNIIWNVLLKSIGIAISFLLLPLTINYLSEVEYGIWVTLVSVLNWINLLDFGISLGLRNKLTEAISKNNLVEARAYLSTAFVSSLLLSCAFFIFFIAIIQLIEFQSFFNTNEIPEKELYYIVLYAGIFIIITFTFSFVDQIFYAFQKVAITGLIQITYNMIMLTIVYCLTLRGEHNVLYFVMSFGMASILSKVLFAGGFFFKYPCFIPQISLFSYEKLKSISSIGYKFFIMQIACILAFSSSNLIITKLLGPEYVRTYDIVFKVFGSLITIHSLIGSALWSACTDAYIKKDYKWISNTVVRLNLLLIVFFIISLLIAVNFGTITNVWLGIQLAPSNLLILSSIIYIIVYCWNSNYAYLLNGMGRVTIQMIGWIVGMIIILPFSIFFIKYLKMGSEGVMLSIICCLLINAVVLPIQMRKILKGE